MFQSEILKGCLKIVHNFSVDFSQKIRQLCINLDQLQTKFQWRIIRSGECFRFEGDRKQKSYSFRRGAKVSAKTLNILGNLSKILNNVIHLVATYHNKSTGKSPNSQYKCQKFYLRTAKNPSKGLNNDKKIQIREPIITLRKTTKLKSKQARKTSSAPQIHQ